MRRQRLVAAHRYRDGFMPRRAARHERGSKHAAFPSTLQRPYNSCDSKPRPESTFRLIGSKSLGRCHQPRWESIRGIREFSSCHRERRIAGKSRIHCDSIILVDLTAPTAADRARRASRTPTKSARAAGSCIEPREREHLCCTSPKGSFRMRLRRGSGGWPRSSIRPPPTLRGVRAP